jgi:hypothetical protein
MGDEVQNIYARIVVVKFRARIHVLEIPAPFFSDGGVASRL